MSRSNRSGEPLRNSLTKKDKSSKKTHSSSSARSNSVSRSSSSSPSSENTVCGKERETRTDSIEAIMMGGSKRRVEETRGSRSGDRHRRSDADSPGPSASVESSSSSGSLYDPLGSTASSSSTCVPSTADRSPSSSPRRRSRVEGTERGRSNSGGSGSYVRRNITGQVKNRITRVGPFILGRKLGEGCTGVVKLAFEQDTGKKVAVKIINRRALLEQPALCRKVQREIAIMKFLKHPRVLCLLDVYENSEFLFLVVEHAPNGEFFDFLIERGPLPVEEAAAYFHQIINGVAYCHNHRVCHRDLKPENLLLDSHHKIKVADFGMSVLTPDGCVSTSCGSPHYACPEIVRGEPYDGMQADIWSCGVVLYAMLSGRLPFDHEDIRLLLSKVKLGAFTFPQCVTEDAQELIRGMLQVDTTKRFTMAQIQTSAFWKRHKDDPCERVPTLEDLIESVEVVGPHEQLDEAILVTMRALNFSRTALCELLPRGEKNLETVIYRALLKVKAEPPSRGGDSPMVMSRSRHEGLLSGGASADFERRVASAGGAVRSKRYGSFSSSKILSAFRRGRDRSSSPANGAELAGKEIPTRSFVGSVFQDSIPESPSLGRRGEDSSSPEMLSILIGENVSASLLQKLISSALDDVGASYKQKGLKYHGKFRPLGSSRSSLAIRFKVEIAKSSGSLYQCRIMLSQGDQSAFVSFS
eukprot:CAMPEP_0177667230 /NCGR_PEP_ID=MMETSP0447-20121125/22007_1 /TAXON_ID=0 /ORGANISM="Stygamoeba regulata, Strain BSH-02190019" /LENGTH=696 /DNA_ID=CAMNT_0019173437 /DNA_START=306 /DNA_END=2393 /DNA_ORIENTATION=+